MTKSTSAPRRGRSLARLLGIGLLAAILVLVWRGSERGGIADAWAVVFGDPDLGPVDFPTLTRRSTPNDALACPADQCPQARSDLDPGIFPVPAERLRAIVAEVAAEDGDTAPVEQTVAGLQDRYIARSRVFRFPDTVDVLVVPLGPERSTLAAYSRSQIGYSDFGVNRGRLERWLERIRTLAAEPAPITDG